VLIKKLIIVAIVKETACEITGFHPKILYNEKKIPQSIAVFITPAIVNFANCVKIA